MSANQNKVERLDFSKPPPGCCIVRGGDGYIFIDKEGGRHQAAMHDLGHDWRQETAQSAAWVHYKARHDPPGMNSLGGFFCSPRTKRKAVEARAAAWVWYERHLALWEKLALAEVVERTFIVDCLWPRILTWSDDEVGEVERWLVDPTAELPEVLAK